MQEAVVSSPGAFDTTELRALPISTAVFLPIEGIQCE
jgi:hypothetical protein